MDLEGSPAAAPLARGPRPEAPAGAIRCRSRSTALAAPLSACVRRTSPSEPPDSQLVTSNRGSRLIGRATRLGVDEFPAVVALAECKLQHAPLVRISQREPSDCSFAVGRISSWYYIV